jgi:hypothetical protein
MPVISLHDQQHVAVHPPPGSREPPLSIGVTGLNQGHSLHLDGWVVQRAAKETPSALVWPSRRRPILFALLCLAPPALMLVPGPARIPLPAYTAGPP